MSAEAEGPKGLLRVVAALVQETDADGQPRIFLARRAPGAGHGGLWELPGGKVEPGEEPGAALIREIEEELGAGLEIVGPARVYEHSLGGRDIVFLVFPSRFLDSPRLAHSHDQLGFFTTDEAMRLKLAPLDGPALEDWANSGTGQDLGRRPRCGA